MRLVDDGVFPGNVGRSISRRPQLKASSTTTAFGMPRALSRRSNDRSSRGAAGAVGEMRVAPDQPAGEPLGIGIEQQLVGVEAVAALGLIGPVDAIAVELPGRDVVEIAVPDVLGAFRQCDRARVRGGPGCRTGTARPSRRWPRTARSWCPGRPSLRRGASDVPAVSRMRQLSGTRKIAASGGMVRLQFGHAAPPASGPRRRCRHCCRRNARSPN